MKVFIFVLFALMVVGCGGEEPKVEEVLCQMYFDCYDNPTVSNLSPDQNPFSTNKDCEVVVRENVRSGDTDCLMKYDNCDVMGSVVDECLEYL